MISCVCVMNTRGFFLSLRLFITGCDGGLRDDLLESEGVRDDFPLCVLSGDQEVLHKRLGRFPVKTHMTGRRDEDCVLVVDCFICEWRKILIHVRR